jgi:hypothetical protein
METRLMFGPAATSWSRYTRNSIYLTVEDTLHSSTKVLLTANLVQYGTYIIQINSIGKHSQIHLAYLLVFILFFLT